MHVILRHFFNSLGAKKKEKRTPRAPNASSKISICRKIQAFALCGLHLLYFKEQTYLEM